MDILDGDCGFVDQYTNGERQAREGHDIDALTK